MVRRALDAEMLKKLKTNIGEGKEGGKCTVEGIMKQNVRVWGIRTTLHWIRACPKLSVWCWLLHDDVIGPFLTAKKAVAFNT
jgi:hypothetical protein